VIAGGLDIGLYVFLKGVWGESRRLTAPMEKNRSKKIVSAMSLH